jgi:hypothetical protein
MLSEKDRSQLLRMAGNIAGSIYQLHNDDWDGRQIASEAAYIAFEILKAVDCIIEEENKDA